MLMLYGIKNIKFIWSSHDTSLFDAFIIYYIDIIDFCWAFSGSWWRHAFNPVKQLDGCVPADGKATQTQQNSLSHVLTQHRTITLHLWERENQVNLPTVCADQPQASVYM